MLKCKHMRAFLKKHWRIFLPIAIMVVIWVFSAMNGSRSDAQSVPIANFLGIPNGLIRKVAHFTLFATLGALWYNYIRNSNIRKFTPGFTFVLSISLAVVYAGIDEMHQLFVPGRSGEINDVLIDSVASVTGVVVFALIHYLTRTKEQKALRRREVEKIWKAEQRRWKKRKKSSRKVDSEKPVAS